MVLISLVSVLAIGCGDTQKDYVFTGTVPTGNTGNVRFLLDRAAAQEAVIPNSSRSADIDFYNSAGTLVLSTSAPLVATENSFEVTVTGVPITATSYELTIRDAEGVPLIVYSDDIAIPVNNTVTADLDFADETVPALASVSLTPATVTLTITNNTTPTAQLLVSGTYANGDTVPFSTTGNTSTNRTITFSSDDLDVANVSAAGLVQAIGEGNAAISAVVTSNGATRNDSTNVEVIDNRTF